MTKNHPDRSGQFMLNNRWLGKLMLKLMLLMLSFSRNYGPSFARNCPEHGLWQWRHGETSAATWPWRRVQARFDTIRRRSWQRTFVRKFQWSSSFLFSCFFFLSEIVWPGRLLEFLDISSTLSVKFPLHTWHLLCQLLPGVSRRPPFLLPTSFFPSK